MQAYRKDTFNLQILNLGRTTAIFSFSIQLSLRA